MNEPLTESAAPGSYLVHRTIRQRLTVVFSCLTALPFCVFAFVYFQIGTFQTSLSGALIALALVLILEGFIIFRRMAEHIERLSGTMEQAGSGKLTRVQDIGETRELAVIADTFNRTLSKLEVTARDLEQSKMELQLALVSKRNAQEQHLASARMAAFGELSVHIAHELNNPLTAILGYADLALNAPNQDEETRSNLEMVRSEASRAGEITGSLLDFFKTESGSRVVTHLNDLVGKTLRLMQGGLTERGIGIDLKLAQPSPVAVVDPGQIGQVFFSLVNNAMNAMTGIYRRPVCMKTGEPGTGQRPLRLRVETRERDGKVLISFTDTGCGIAPDDLTKVFDPFFSTQERVTQVGLGLWVSYRIIEAHGGKIQVKSVPGKGSVFVVVLPAQK